MHIADGVLSWPVLVTGAAAAAAGVAIGLRKTDQEQLPRVAVLASAFFVASLIHVPVGPSSAHLVLNGLAGIVLGWAAFPAILVALFLQAILFGFGGLTALGANTLTMALPAVACYYLFNRHARGNGTAGVVFAAGFAAGAAGIGLAAALVSAMLYATGSEFVHVAQLVLIGHVPLMCVEGVVTGSVLVLLRQVRPQVLAVPSVAPQEKG